RQASADSWQGWSRRRRSGHVQPANRRRGRVERRHLRRRRPHPGEDAANREVLEGRDVHQGVGEVRIRPRWTAGPALHRHGLAGPNLRLRPKKRSRPDLRSGWQLRRCLEAVRTPERYLHQQRRHDLRCGTGAGDHHRQREGRIPESLCARPDSPPGSEAARRRERGRRFDGKHVWRRDWRAEADALREEVSPERRLFAGPGSTGRTSGVAYWLTILSSVARITAIPPIPPFSLTSPVTVTVWLMCGTSFAFMSAARPPPTW